MSTVTTPSAITVCTECGRPVAAGEARCASCRHERYTNSERLVLLIVGVLLIAMFVLAQSMVRLHRQTEMSLAKMWFSRGDRAMPGYPNIAAEDYRTALTYDRENDEYRLRLAEALLAANHFPEARAHLISLWDEEPADGEVNLALARLFAKQGNPGEAVRYYRNAINGVWPDQPREHRVATRFELVQYLMHRQDLRQAEAELIALQADAPHDEDQQLRLAQLLLQIGDAARAQGVYEEILKTDPANAQAWLGDGKSSFAMGDYAAAERELSTAVEHDKNLSEAHDLLELTREVLRIAPSLRGLSLSERARRVAEAFDAAVKRLNSCAAERGYNFNQPLTVSSLRNDQANTQGNPSAMASTAAPNNLQLLFTSAQQKKDSATEQALRRNPDAMESIMDFVFDVERATQPLCADLTMTDRALLILAKHQGGIQ